MNSVGIFTTTRSLQHIMDIDQEIRTFCNVTYLPYTTLEHLLYLYEQNAEQFDALIFSGSYPYNVIRKRFPSVEEIPHSYFNISDRDYYQLIAHLAVQNPELDFSRIYFDRPEIPVDFHSIFLRDGVPLLGTAPIDWSTVDAADWYQPLKLYYKEIWDSGKVELLVTRFGSMEDYFRQHNIRHRFLFPSPGSMLETFRGLVMQLRTQSMHDSAACLGLIRSIMPLSKEQWAALGDRLQACNKQFGTPFLIYEHGEHYEITTNISVLKDLTQQYTICPVTAFLEAGLDFPICTAWGCAGNVVDAHRNAQRALKEALLCKGSAAFIVMEDNTIIGPLSSVRRISYTDAPDEKRLELSRRLSISPLYLSKIVSVLTQKGNDTLSAEELSFYLDITPRSALRILSKLEAGGYASVQFRRQLNLRGRPAKIYQIHIQDLT